MRQAYQIALIIVKFQSEYNPSIDNALEGPRRRIVQAIFLRRQLLANAAIASSRVAS